jgi:hypothetical protein
MLQPHCSVPRSLDHELVIGRQQPCVAVRSEQVRPDDEEVTWRYIRYLGIHAVQQVARSAGGLGTLRLPDHSPTGPDSYW